MFLALVDSFLADIEAGVVAIDRDIGRRAIEAFARYGRGPHPAGLNLGDCFAFACAKRFNTPMLCKGNDFPRTDVDLA